jgi:hypothetical protein
MHEVRFLLGRLAAAKELPLIGISRDRCVR